MLTLQSPESPIGRLPGYVGGPVRGARGGGGGGRRGRREAEEEGSGGGGGEGGCRRLRRCCRCCCCRRRRCPPAPGEPDSSPEDGAGAGRCSALLRRRPPTRYGAAPGPRGGRPQSPQPREGARARQETPLRSGTGAAGPCGARAGWGAGQPGCRDAGRGSPSSPSRAHSGEGQQTWDARRVPLEASAPPRLRGEFPGCPEKGLSPSRSWPGSEVPDIHCTNFRKTGLHPEVGGCSVRPGSLSPPRTLLMGTRTPRGAARGPPGHGAGLPPTSMES